MYQVFVDEENQITLITRFLSATINLALRNYSKKQNITLKELTTLAVGDYVHIDHGIGRFGGLQKIQVENRTQKP
jgi:transcription-repair coupling factor (superfamily II helicase)